MKKSIATLWILSAVISMPALAQMADGQQPAATPMPFSVPGSAVKGRAAGAADQNALQDATLSNFDEETKAFLKQNPGKFSLAFQLQFLRSLPYLKLDGCKDCSPMQISQVAPLVDLYGLASVLKATSLATADEAKAAADANTKAAEGTKVSAWTADQGAKIWMSLATVGSTKFIRTQLPMIGQQPVTNTTQATADQTKKDMPTQTVGGPNQPYTVDAGTAAAAELDQPSADFGKKIEFSTNS